MTGPKFRNYWPLSYVIWVLIMIGKGRYVSYSTGKNGIFLSETITQKTSLTPLLKRQRTYALTIQKYSMATNMLCFKNKIKNFNVYP